MPFIMYGGYHMIFQPLAKLQRVDMVNVTPIKRLGKYPAPHTDAILTVPP